MRLTGNWGLTFGPRPLKKGMANTCISFENIDGVTPDEIRNGKIKPIYDHVNMHMIFDINMDGNFTIKVILVADGHKTETPSSIIY